ncbi:MAG: RDD family protein [Pseudomonadota bacterium]
MATMQSSPIDNPNHPDPIQDAQFYAGVPSRRFFAWVVDTVIVGIAAFLVGIASFGIGLILFPLTLLLMSVVYRTWTIGNASATWGMQLMGIELRDQRGHRFDARTALWHTLLYSVCIAFFVLQVVSIVMMLGSRRSQGLPDVLLDTVAINRPLH